MKWLIVILSLSICSLTFAMEKGAMKRGEPDVKMTHQDIQKTFGLFPTFLKMYPESGLPALWQEYKSVQLNPETALSGKLKQLIGIGLAAQIPSKECNYISTEFAKLNGANEEEVKEAVAMAAATRHWSTYLNGIQYDDAEFHKDTNAALAYVKKEMENPNRKSEAEKAMVIVGAQSAYQDIKNTFGAVPQWMMMVPEDFISGAWKMMKSVQLNSHTALSGKEKELIGLAISAQIPCKFCAYFHTEAAKLNGATDEEIRETVVVASVTRQWSAIVHGGQLDENKFRKEVDQMVKFVREKSSKNIGQR